MSSRSLRLLALVLGANISTVTSASTWVVVFEGPAATAWVDTDTIRRKGSKIKTWVKIQFPTPTPIYKDKPTPTFRFARQLYELNCQNRTTATIQTHRYLLEASPPVDSDITPENLLSHKDVVPDTIGESVLDFSCKFRSR